MALVRVLVVLAFLSGLSADELVVRDVGLDLRYLQDGYDYDIADPAGSRNGSNSFDTGYEAAVGGRYSFTSAGDAHGFIVGGDLCYALREGEAISLQTYGARAVGGYAFAFADRWVLSAEGHLDYGLGTLDVEGGTRFDDVSGSGSWFGYGADVGIAYAITDHLQVCLEAGYDAQDGTYDLNGVDTDLQVSGFRVALGFTWRISIAPPSLE